MEKIRSWLNQLAYWLSSLWLVGSLFRAGRRAYADALYEFAYALVWSIFPFILGALTLYVTSDDPNKDFMAFTVSTFRNGELLIYTISMLTPILYLVLHDPAQADKFPHKLPMSTLVTVIAVTSSALFALMKAHAIKDSDFVLQLSITLTLLALLIRYLSLVYHRLRMPDMRERDLRADEINFIHRYSEHVGSTVPQAQPATDFADAFARHVGEQQ